MATSCGCLAMRLLRNRWAPPFVPVLYGEYQMITKFEGWDRHSVVQISTLTRIGEDTIEYGLVSQFTIMAAHMLFLGDARHRDFCKNFKEYSRAKTS